MTVSSGRPKTGKCGCSATGSLNNSFWSRQRGHSRQATTSSPSPFAKIGFSSFPWRRTVRGDARKASTTLTSRKWKVFCCGGDGGKIKILLLIGNQVGGILSMSDQLVFVIGGKQPAEYFNVKEISPGTSRFPRSSTASLVMVIGDDRRRSSTSWITSRVFCNPR